MKHRYWESTKLQAMRKRFQKCGIAVNDARTEKDGGIDIAQDESPLACQVFVYRLGIVQYVLRLQLISDDPNRMIYGYFIESDFEPVRVLAPWERVDEKYVGWSAKEDILNNRIKQPFGPTHFREGLLLGEGLRSPVLDRRNHWASITVGVVDQFDNCYEKRLHVAVTDYSCETHAVRDPGRKSGDLYEPAAPVSGGYSGGLYEPDEEEAEPL